MKDNTKIFDEQLKPLVEQILDICEKNEINVFASFQYAPMCDKGVPLNTSMFCLGSEDDDSLPEYFHTLSKGQNK